MAVIANATVETLPEPWSGAIRSGRHQLITDKPESFGGQDQGLAPYDLICSGLISLQMKRCSRRCWIFAVKRPSRKRCCAV